MLKNYLKISPFTNKFNFYFQTAKFFTGKTETGHKFTTPTMRMKSIKPIFPPPGDNLVIPKWTTELFCEKVGGDCHTVADKFENIQEIFTIKTVCLNY